MSIYIRYACTYVRTVRMYSYMKTWCYFNTKSPVGLQNVPLFFCKITQRYCVCITILLFLFFLLKWFETNMSFAPYIERIDSLTYTLIVIIWFQRYIHFWHWYCQQTTLKCNINESHIFCWTGHSFRLCIFWGKNTRKTKKKEVRILLCIAAAHITDYNVWRWWLSIPECHKK